ncbi:efflux RND transporter periplasmic adaptor subunit [Anaeroselena agilis]|uniref:Efflux RND transporter periplasmic adaptor subunit n=1 Tax=Anaeroselena agilis TaxID=3063788 RepID=A0ABU3P2D8_9FIRM|nr:efflux RND transporter periplasmic adaptor subunit [Selenomonadales bacterium 4137-cl]
MQAIWQKIRQYKWWIIALIILAVAAKFGSDYYAKSKKPAFTGTVMAVERGDVQAIVSATGTISPVNSVDVSSKITGRIVEVKVNENDIVKADQVLILLDDDRLRTTVSQAQAKLANAAANYERNRQLAAIGAISTQQLDASRMEYQVAQATHDDAASQLNDTIIKAPIDGIVIGKPIPAGQTVSPGISTPMVLMTIADMSKMQISVQVDESDVGRVKKGQKVSFTVDAYPDKTFAGTVSNVSNKASIQSNVVYYPVTVDIDSPQGLLKPTMTARVSIHVGESKNVLIVPLSAVKQTKGQQYVQVMKDGKPQNVTVKLGLASDDRVEIADGLKDGDKILLSASKAPGQGGHPGGNPLRGIR